MKTQIYTNNGFTLVELIVVIAILAILVAMSIPIVSKSLEKAETEVCKANCKQLERMYEAYLVTESLEHTDNVFQQFLLDYGQEICPSGGVITYVNGHVCCSVHDGDEVNPYDGEEEDDDGVPFL